MKRTVIMIAAAGYALSALTTIAVAAPKAHKAAAVKTIKCPACGMPMPTKRTAMMTVPVKVKGVTYYCCPGCPAGKKAAAAKHK